MALKQTHFSAAHTHTHPSVMLTQLWSVQIRGYCVYKVSVITSQWWLLELHRKLNVNTYFFSAFFSQEIQQMTSRPAREGKHCLTCLSVSVFQLRQMLSTSWQISPEQKEDEHQEKHTEPRLQWNIEGDALWHLANCICRPYPVDLMTLPD